AFFCQNVPTALQVSNLYYLHVTEVLSIVSILCLNVLLVFILYTRKKNPNSTLPGNIQLYFIGQPLALYAILNGIPQLVTGLLLGVLPFLGLILFNRKHVFFATCLMWIEIVGLAIAVSAGLLPNAPLFIDQVKPAQVPMAFLLVQILMSAPIAAVVYIIGHSLMQGIVLREKKILELSRRDGLTGLWNRRYLNEVLEHEIALTHRNLYCLSVLILDLDFFKKINDTYGHQTGDKVLLATTAVLQKCARTTDYVGRFGGEEFIVILPNCDARMSIEVADRYRKSIEAQKITVGDYSVQVTASFGVTTMLPSNTCQYNMQVCLDDLINTADKALYEAKELGRNCVKFRHLSEDIQVSL
ncbi:MAG: GGDEF domain-containing protein, partial [Candidatus Saccharibacteria bacterium]|nr:GGDEF domain-containing protein [Moraxellaceae bacterium]